MANEVELTYAASVALEASGASCANAAFIAADDTSLASGNHSNFPYADFVLKTNGFGASIASNANGFISLYRQDINVAGDTNADAGAPATTYRTLFVGNFIVPNSIASTGNQYLPLMDVPLSSHCQFSLENSSSQSLSAGWTLTVAPKTYIPGS